MEGSSASRSWNQEHNLSTGIIWTPGNWVVSAALLWHSGWRTTRLPATVGPWEVLDLSRNADTLPSFLSLDAKVARTWHRERSSLTLFAEVTNALDRVNVGAYEYDVEELDDGGYGVFPERVTLLPVCPPSALDERSNSAARKRIDRHKTVISLSILVIVIHCLCTGVVDNCNNSPDQPRGL